MIKSMTGFGRGEYSDGKRIVTAEIKSVNHRYMDINVKMPKRYSFAEESIKSIVKEKLKRGKAEISIIIENLSEDLRDLKDTYSLEGDVDLKLIASMPDVLRAVPDVENEDAAEEAIKQAVSAAAGNLEEMRAIEGRKLSEDLIMRGRLVRDIVKKIDKRAPAVAKEYTDRLRSRIAELIGDAAQIPEERILMEAAVFADKANITEEIVRLDSHMAQLEKILCSGEEPSGKKLDFLVQEMNREANTIGSKANDMEITSLMLEAKSEIEKIREQVQNIE